MEGLISVGGQWVPPPRIPATRDLYYWDQGLGYVRAMDSGVGANPHADVGHCFPIEKNLQIWVEGHT